MPQAAFPTARTLSRRNVLALAGAGAVGLWFPRTSRAQQAGVWQRVEEAAAFVGDAAPAPQGLTLELPLVSENGASVPLTVRADRPMSSDPHVEEIRLYAPRNPDPEIAIFRFTPLSGRAEVATRVRLNETQTVIALARLNSGEMLVTEQEVRVTTSGCLMVDDTYAADNILQTRLRVPEMLAAGEPGEVLSIINHPMETGLRTDSSGNTLPRRIVERLEASLDGEPAFVAELKRSVSANPYLRFFVAPRQSATLDLTWFEDTGTTAEASGQIAVG